MVSRRGGKNLGVTALAQLRRHFKQVHQFKPGVYMTWNLAKANQVHDLDHLLRVPHRHDWQ